MQFWQNGAIKMKNLLRQSFVKPGFENSLRRFGRQRKGKLAEALNAI
jgi:hypothetical protein